MPQRIPLAIVKRVFRYLEGTSEFGIWYPKNQKFELSTYTDVDWEGSLDDRKITNGNAVFLGDCLIAWSSRKQSSISFSNAEAEYIAAAECCTQILWIKQSLEEIQVNGNEPTPIYCDNTNAISISKNHVLHSKTKHIPI